MRIARFQEFALQTYRQAPGIVDARPWEDGTNRPFGIEVQLAAGATVRHAITRVRVEDEDLNAEEQPVEGEAPPPVDDVPEPSGRRDRATAGYLAALLTNSGNAELAHTYVYDSEHNPGLGAVFHSGAKVHMLLK